MRSTRSPIEFSTAGRQATRCSKCRLDAWRTKYVPTIKMDAGKCIPRIFKAIDAALALPPREHPRTVLESREQLLPTCRKQPQHQLAPMEGDYNVALERVPPSQRLQPNLASKHAEDARIATPTWQQFALFARRRDALWGRTHPILADCAVVAQSVYATTAQSAA